MEGQTELDLVCKAIVSHVTGDCEWKDSAARNVRSDPDLNSLTPEGIKDLLQQYVKDQGCQVINQVKENRPEYSDRCYYYKVIISVDQFKHGFLLRSY